MYAKSILRIIAITALLFSLTGYMYADSTITGYVKAGAYGDPILGATIRIMNFSGVVLGIGTTDSNGQYSIAGITELIPITISCSVSGYSTMNKNTTSIPGINFFNFWFDEPDPPTASISGTSSVCRNATSPNITFTGSDGTAPYTFTYKINNGTNLTVTTTSGSSVTVPVSTSSEGTLTYSLVNVEDHNFSVVCSGSAAVTINALPATPTITAGGSTIFCSGGSVSLTSSSGTSYLWSNGATTSSIDPNSSGSYSVQVTNSNGCQSAASAATAVTVNPLPATPTITAGSSTTFCSGGSVSLTSSSGTSYLWSNGATTSSINATTSGSYTVRITNSNGCQSAASAATAVTVNSLPATPTITAEGSTTFCSGGSVSLTSSSGTSYLWSNGATTSSIDPNSSGSYSVQVTNSNGCQSAASDATTVTVNPLPATPTITAGGATTFCSGGSVSLTSSSGTSYLWSNGATTSSINATTSGSYTVRVTNSNGCQSAASAATAVTVNPLPATPTITAGGSTNICSGGSVSLTSSSGTSYLWSNGATTSSIDPNSSGSYSVQVTNSNGCQSAASAATIVTVNPLPATPTITAGGATTFCSGGSVSLTSSSGTSYLWSNGATSSSINATTSGNYTVRVINSNGCQSAASDATTVTVNPLPATPTITAGGATTFCSGGSVSLTSSSGTSYLWSNGATSSSINATTSGNYTVRVTNSNGCQSAASVATEVVLIVNNTLAATITDNTNISCYGLDNGIAIVTPAGGTAPYTYQWDDDLNTTDSIVTGLSGNTYYNVVVSDDNSCTVMDSVYISEPDSITIESVIPGVLCQGESNGSININANGGTPPYEYLWSTNDTTTSITNIPEGKYWIKVTDSNGCSKSDTIILSSSALYYVPKICIVTMDTITRKNLVVWERETGKGIKSYKIYKEGQTSIDTVLIGTVPFDSLSVFLDEYSEPEKYSHKYWMTTVDSCGIESGYSAYHQAILLSSSSDDDRINLTWSEYDAEEFDNLIIGYKILRSNTTMNYSVISSLSSSTTLYPDLDPPDGTNYYIIAAILLEECKPTGGKLKAGTGPYIHSLSNLDDNKLKGTGIFDYPLSSADLAIYPNPFNRSTTIQFPNPASNSYKMIISDLSGKMYRVESNITTSEFVLKKGELRPGMYFIELIGSKIYRGKIVIE